MESECHHHQIGMDYLFDTICKMATSEVKLRFHLKRVDRPVSTIPNSIDGDVNGVLRLDRQAQLVSDLCLQEEVVPGVDNGVFVVGGPASAFLGGTEAAWNLLGMLPSV